MRRSGRTGVAPAESDRVALIIGSSFGRAPSAGRAQGVVQSRHELRDAVLADRRGGIPTKYSDQGRCGALPSLLDHPVPDLGIVACVDFGYPRCTCSGAENVTHLVSFRDRVEVRRGCGIACGARSETCGFGRSFLRCSVCVQRGDALQRGPSRTVDEHPRGIKGGARSRITGLGVLEHGEDFLSGLRCVARYDSQLVHGQLEVT
jgi:hypothetical protein